MKQRKGCRTSCDVGKAAEGLQNKLWRRWSDVRVGEGGRATLLTSQALHLRHSSFYNPSATSPTSHVFLQPFRCFSYVTAHPPTLPPLHLSHSSFYNASPTSTALPLLHLRHRHFTYVTTHSASLPPLHLRHRSFYNPSIVWPTSQALHILHLASCPCIGGWKTVCGGLAYYSKLLSLEVATVLDSC